jgi:hypothetical protein
MSLGKEGSSREWKPWVSSHIKTALKITHPIQNYPLQYPPDSELPYLYWLGKMVLDFGVAHRIPYVVSDGADGGLFPAGCYALVGFATDDIAIAPERIGNTMAVLCTERIGVPERTPANLHVRALITFSPSSLPPAIFSSLRNQDCPINKAVPGKWNPRRTSVAVHISELWHVLTSRKKCTRRWFEAHPRFVDLEGFLRVPVNPHAGLPLAVCQVRFIHSIHATSQDCL